MTAISLETYDRLVSRIYEATLDRARWQLVVDDLARVANGAHVALLAHDFKANYNLGAITTHDPEFIASYEQYYAATNCWVPTLARMPFGIAQQPEAHFDREQLIRTEFYNGWLRPQGILTAAGIILHRDENRFLALAINIDARQEDRVKAPMLQLLDRLAPHLRRSFDLMRQLSGQNIDPTLDESLDVAPTATFLIDRRGRLTQTNSLGEILLTQGHAIRVRADRQLVFIDARAQKSVDRALTALVGGDHPHMSATFQARSEAGFAPVQGTIVPFRPAPAFDTLPLSIVTDHLPAAIIVVSQPRMPSGLSLLADRYSLTTAERRVAEAIFAGKTLQAYADDRGVSIHTARNQLKSLMAKAGVARQSQLVALIAAMPNSGP